ncbi:hypothetical protein QAD02_002378 [Eretmocerus hayati]|uniref:Uncharacterized protein n=1 Tax=Eretmocerus hayati TaxID=131215 RepID=A0ACC2NLC8_9HYME|nr:hypothetical protein QAD02_002378 [Eretmocerus hayati]
METSKESLQHDLNVFLKQYRKAPHATTGQSPPQLFLGRNIRTRIDLVRHESVHSRISEEQRIGFTPSYHSLETGQHVYILSGNPRLDKWIPGIVVMKNGDLHYQINYQGIIVKRHIDQIRPFGGSNDSDESQSLRDSVDDSSQRTLARRLKRPSSGARTEEHQPPNDRIQRENEIDRDDNIPENAQQHGEGAAPCEEPIRDQPLQENLRRSSRARRPPQFFSPS